MLFKDKIGVIRIWFIEFCGLFCMFFDRVRWRIRMGIGLGYSRLDFCRLVN